MDKYLLGFDIGGTKCAVILGRADCDSPSCLFVDKLKFQTDAKRGWRSVLEELFSSAESLLRDHSLTRYDLKSIGISCGGPLDGKAGVIMSPPNLPDWDNVPIISLTEERFQVPVFLANDADACAVAEWRFGAGRGCDNMIFLTFGTGMGAGLILNGSLYTGATNTAGEVGHIRLSDSGPLGYGKHGSFEGYCSGGGIADAARSAAKEAIKADRAPSFCKKLEDLDAVTAKSVADAADSGDPLALEIYRKSGEYLGRGLSVLIDVLNPEMIVIGSIYARSENLLAEAMLRTVKTESLPVSAAACRIVPAALGERIGDFAALGVAEMKR